VCFTFNSSKNKVNVLFILLLFFYRNFVAKIFSQKTSIHTEYYTKFIRFIEQFVIFVAQKLFNMAIGSTIRKLRTAKKLSQQYVADTLNIDRRTYAAWAQEAQEIKSSYIPLVFRTILQHPTYLSNI
jgi:DNA-binding XRE family transcriptional regulator